MVSVGTFQQNEYYRWQMPNKRLKRDCQRVAFPVPLSRGGFGGLCLGLVVMRCQPLRRALGVHQLCEPKVERERKTDFRNFGYLRWN